MNIQSINIDKVGTGKWVRIIPKFGLPSQYGAGYPIIKCPRLFALWLREVLVVYAKIIKNLLNS